MSRRPAPVVALLAVLALTVGLISATTEGADAKRPHSLTRKALRNAPIKKVCGGWKGHFKKGVLTDAQGYESIRVARTALGNLNGKGGRDGAVVVQCGTRTPHPDYIVAYTANKRGKPVLRSVRSLPSVDKSLSRYDGYVTKFRIKSRRVVARWDSSEVDILGENTGVVPTVGKLALRKGKLKVTSIQRQGLRWLTARFAAAMVKKDYAAASRIGSAGVVQELKSYPTTSWTQAFTWYYGDWQPGDDRYKGWASFDNAGFQLDLLYDEKADIWRITGVDIFH